MRLHVLFRVFIDRLLALLQLFQVFAVKRRRQFDQLQLIVRNRLYGARRKSGSAELLHLLFIALDRFRVVFIDFFVDTAVFLRPRYAVVYKLIEHPVTVIRPDQQADGKTEGKQQQNSDRRKNTAQKGENDRNQTQKQKEDIGRDQGDRH